MNQVKEIQRLVEKFIGKNLDYAPDPKDLIQVDIPVTQDFISLIKYYINNQHLITKDFISNLVRTQISKNNFKSNKNQDNLIPSLSWDDYIKKLEDLLELVRYRRRNGFEYNEIMPTQRQLQILQEECLFLTEKWYGKGNGNLSCFYCYFIAMSQESGVTCFKYDNIDKYISHDGYVSIINATQRYNSYLLHEEFLYHDFVMHGGILPSGRSEIDATFIPNIFYYKKAQLLCKYMFAKKLVVASLKLENYGQLPVERRIDLWRLLYDSFYEYTDSDENNIFNKFIKSLTLCPDKFYKDLLLILPEAKNVSRHMIFDIIKIVGIETKCLVLFSRTDVDDWIPKRYFTIEWHRFNGELELARILPNSMPYDPGHGLSMCSSGFLDGGKYYGTIEYEWNTPINFKAEKSNYWRDIEKIFKDLNLLCPKVKNNSLLPKEELISIFQNSMSYSTILSTEHTHITSCSINNYPAYLELHNSYELEIPEFNAVFQLVAIGYELDAFFLKVFIKDLNNSALLKFLVQMNSDLFKHFGGVSNIDCYLHLFATDTEDFVFIYQPHARLIELEQNKFLNPDNNTITPRRPQLFLPETGNVSFIDNKNEMASGSKFLRSFFDQTRKSGTYNWLYEYINLYIKTRR